MDKEFEDKEENSNEALESLKEIEKRCQYDYEYGDICYDYEEELSTIKHELLKAQELEKENAELRQHIKRWHDLLLKTGINSKGTVVDEIENYWQIKTEK